MIFKFELGLHRNGRAKPVALLTGPWLGCATRTENVCSFGFWSNPEVQILLLLLSHLVEFDHAQWSTKKRP